MYCDEGTEFSPETQLPTGCNNIASQEAPAAPNETSLTEGLVTKSVVGARQVTSGQTKRAARRERKATKTLAIVLGIVNSMVIL